MVASSYYIEDLINLCWFRTTKQILVDYIYIKQVANLVREIENALLIKSFFIESEVDLLNQMINNKPNLKLHKKDLEQFLLKLVQYPNFDLFLMKRFNISVLDLKKIIYVPYKHNFNSMSVKNKSLNSYILEDDNGDNKLTNNNKLYINSPTFDSNVLNSPKSKEILETKVSDNKKIQCLESKILELNEYIFSLESQSENKFIAEIENLKNQIEIKNLKIKELDDLCSYYKITFDEIKDKEMKNEKTINELQVGIESQSLIISNLKSKLNLNENPDFNSKPYKNFLINLPFLKQYYFFFKYKKEVKNINLMVLNIITLILTCIIIVNIIKFLFLALLSICYPSFKNDAYIYKKNGLKYSRINSTFVWWKEIRWIDYTIYTIKEWINNSKR